MNKPIAAALATTVLLAIGTSPSVQAVPVEFGLSPGPADQQPLTPASQQNAVRAAKNYLDYTAFSRKGLIEQLEYDGYSTEDATFAVDSINVNWNEQAAKAAKNYLEYSAFSRSGLIEQLLYDGYTSSQAQYGVATTGL